MAFAPVVRQVADSVAGCAAVVQVNTQENPGIGRRFGVRGIPALYLLRQGKVVDHLSGSQPLAAVLSWFRRYSECR